jgi:glycosyltransferase involved in cell wall biosynthesis
MSLWGCVDASGLLGRMPVTMKKLLFVVNVDWFFLSHRLPIGLSAQKAGFEVHIATGITDKLAVLRAHGFKVHGLGLVRDGVGLLNALQTVLELRHIIRQVRPDVVHLVTIKPVVLGGLVARWTRVPALVSAVSGLGYLFTARGLKASLRRGLVGRVYAWALGHGNQAVIFQNRDDRDTLMAATGLSSSKVEMIRGSGVDLTQFKVAPELAEVPVVLFPARLLIDKGVFEFVAAARLLRAKGLLARFVLAGLLDKANPTSVTQAQLDGWLAEGAVEYWGFRSDMPRVLASANVVVLPSYREGLPKALLEAAACGRAVVTADVPGCRDAIEPGVTGLLVPVRDVGGLALAIEQLLTHPEQRKAMGMAGRRLAEREFDLLAVVDKHLAIYRRLLA